MAHSQVKLEKPVDQLASLHDLDVARMRARFDLLLATQPESLQRYGRLLFERIAVSNWSVEWNLARWLGARSGLTAIHQERLVAVNVFGLGYIRLHDDRRDGERQEADEVAARALEALLFEAASGELHELVGEDPSFWHSFEAIMAGWEQAAIDPAADIDVRSMSPAQIDRLADIGAPLLITCAACAALGPGIPEHGAMEKPVRHYLSAAVLYDHMKDWADDLAAGRPNLFVAAMLENQPENPDHDTIRQQIQRALIQIHDVQSYSALVIQELVRGADAAQALGMETFAQHLRALAGQANETGAQTLEGIQQYLMQGTALFFPV